MSGSPIAELRSVSRGTLALLALLGVAKGLTLVGLATGVALAISGDQSGLALGAASALARALVAWSQRVVSGRALVGSKERLRARVADSALASRLDSPAEVASLATDGLDELDKYYTVYLPALVTAATVPLVVGARILSADWVSALVLVLTVPLIPIFMALIGLHTHKKVAESATALARLSTHLVELARGLPVLIGLSRAADQATALRDVSERHRRSTIATLRTAFLSSLALELIATLSVAVIAVFIGVRLIGGDLTLSTGLLVLILAPEVLAPFRDIGVAFHAAQSGREALARAEAIVEAPVSATAGDDEVDVRDLTVTFAARSQPAVEHLSFAATPGTIVLLDGRSGCGKSTVLTALAGRLPHGASVIGALPRVAAGQVAWLPQHPRFVEETFLAELERYGASAESGSRLLAELGLADLEVVNASPGELRRLAVARVAARVECGASLVLLDEPTAQLDRASAASVVQLIDRMRRTATIVMASHDTAARDLADTVVVIGTPATGTTAVDARASRSEALSTIGPVPDSSARRAFREFVRPVRGRLAAAIALATLASLFAISLTGLSGWLIVQASTRPPIMYLMVAIVGVRFFGIGRAVLRYGDRLLGHDAVFRATTELRMRLWSSLARSGVSGRAALRAGDTLDLLVRQADRVRDLTLRVVVPIASGLVALVAFTVVAMVIAPSPLVIVFALAVGILAPIAALWGDRRATRTQEQLRSTVLRRFSSMVMAADDLRANGVDGGVRSELATLDRRATASARRSAWALGLGSAVVIAACGLASLGFAATEQVPRGLLAMLALAALALAEPLADAVSAVQLVPSLSSALRAVDVPPTVDSTLAPCERIDSIELDQLAAGWNGRPVVTDATARVTRGEWLTITGPSGSGKSTLLAVLLGQTRPLAGRYLVNGHDATVRNLTPRIGWCPQEGHLFDSTLRGNLLIARDRDHAPTDEEMSGILRLVGLGDLLETLPAGLDTAIGREGSSLSGGERQRLAVARALLTGADVIVVDEPTAHLDEESASRLMHDLRAALADRIVVLVTHHPFGIEAGDQRVELGGRMAMAA